MGEVQLYENKMEVVLHAVIYLYGNAASEILANTVAADISSHWNEPSAEIFIKNSWYKFRFDISGIFDPALTPEHVHSNTNPKNNYFRIEEFASGNISFVDGINSNTGYFKLDNLLNNSTTAAHEFGHTLGLEHPHQLDIRGAGVPGIMYPRGTITDPQFQYNPTAMPLMPGGTMNPFHRKVLLSDINNLKIHKLAFNESGTSILGDFTSIWHEPHHL